MEETARAVGGLWAELRRSSSQNLGRIWVRFGTSWTEMDRLLVQDHHWPDLDRGPTYAQTLDLVYRSDVVASRIGNVPL